MAPNIPLPVGAERATASLQPSSSLWDRITGWCAENKATVYTIAGITVVVTAAGAVYYFSDSTSKTSDPASADKKKAKKDKRKAKKEAEKSGTATPEKKPEPGVYRHAEVYSL